MFVLSDMDDDDKEVSNILYDYIKAYGVPKGAGTKSKFSKVLTAFKEENQLGYHKYLFQPDYPGDPKPLTENFEEDLWAWARIVSEYHRTLLKEELDQQFMEKTIVHLKCNSDKGCYRAYDKWIPKNHELRRSNTPRPKLPKLGADWYAETTQWMNDVKSVAEGPDFKLLKLKKTHSIVFALPVNERPSIPERNRFKSDEDFSSAVNVFVSLVQEKNAELKKQMETEKKRVQQQQASSPSEITIDFGLGSIRGSQEEFQMMTQWTEIRQKLIDEVHQSVQWKVMQQNEKGYVLDFPAVWSWVSQDEWMAEYNAKLQKLKKVALTLSERRPANSFSKKILTFKKSDAYQYLISNGVTDRPKTPDLDQVDHKEAAALYSAWKQDVFSLLPDDRFVTPIQKW